MASTDRLTCKLCFERYDFEDHRPKVLVCGHTFCQSCLTRLPTNQGRPFSCPNCRRQIEVACLNELPDNYEVLDILSSDVEEAPVSPSEINSTGLCEEHNEHKQFKCKSCRVWICHVCTVVDHPRDRCNIVAIKVAIDEMRTTTRTRMEECRDNYKEELARINDHDLQLKDKEKALADHLARHDQMMEQYRQLLETIKQERDSDKSLHEEGIHKKQEIITLMGRLAGVDRVPAMESCMRLADDYSSYLENWSSAKNTAHNTSTTLATSKQALMLSNLSLDVRTSSLTDNLRDYELGNAINASVDALVYSVAVQRTIQVVGNGKEPRYGTVVVNGHCLRVDALSTHKTKDSLCPVVPLAELLGMVSNVYVEHKQNNVMRYLQVNKSGKIFLMKLVEGLSNTQSVHLIVSLKALVQARIIWLTDRANPLDHPRVSHIQKKGQKAVFNAMEEVELPENCVTIMLSEMESVLTVYGLVFLKLAWGGETRGTLTIKLESNSVRAQQFFKLCTGECGQSLTNTSLKLASRSQGSEVFIGGDYDGTGGAPLITNIPMRENTERPLIAGILEGTGQHHSTKFRIQMRDDSQKSSRTFGRVVSGLECLQAALELEIEDITIIKCGAQLPL